MRLSCSPFAIREASLLLFSIPGPDWLLFVTWLWSKIPLSPGEVGPRFDSSVSIGRADTPAWTRPSRTALDWLRTAPLPKLKLRFGSEDLGNIVWNHCKFLSFMNYLWWLLGERWEGIWVYLLLPQSVSAWQFLPILDWLKWYILDLLHRV